MKVSFEHEVNEHRCIAGDHYITMRPEHYEMTPNGVRLSKAGQAYIDKATNEYYAGENAKQRVKWVAGITDAPTDRKAIKNMLKAAACGMKGAGASGPTYDAMLEALFARLGV